MLRVALIAALLAPTAAAAQPAQGGERANLFISPAGQPWRAEPGAAYPAGTWFRQADADGDGALTLGEFEADATRFFAVLDANRDGKIDNLETVNYETKLVPEILPRERRITSADVAGAETLPARGPSGGHRPSDRRSVSGKIAPRGAKKAPLDMVRKGAGMFGLLNEPQPVAASDTDFNSIITAQEWSQAARRRFTRLDSNADRRLVEDELPATPVQVLRGDQ